MNIEAFQSLLWNDGARRMVRAAIASPIETEDDFGVLAFAPAAEIPAAWMECRPPMPSPETVSAFSEDRMALGLARIEAHYFRNAIFLGENQLLDGVEPVNPLLPLETRESVGVPCQCPVCGEEYLDTDARFVSCSRSVVGRGTVPRPSCAATRAASTAWR
jgi:hypothetical protein